MADETLDTPIQDPPKSAKLYQNLIKDGYTTTNLGSYDEFNKALQDPIKANKIYSGLRSDGYTEDNLGSLKEFQTTFSQKKNPIGNGGLSIPGLSQPGSNLIPSSPQNTDLTPVLPENRDEVRQQQQAQIKAQSDQLKKLRSELPKESQDNWDKAIQISNAIHPDQLSQPTKEETDHYNFMQTPAGKLLGATAYVGSEATHGTLQIAKGIAHIANLANNTGEAMAGIDPTGDTFKKLDKVADFGLTEGDKQRIQDMSIPTVNGHKAGVGAAISSLGMLANFAPQAAIGEATSAPKALLYLQGLGQGKEVAEKMQGLNPLAKEALIQGTGLVNLTLSDLGDNVFGKGVSAAVKDKVTTGIAAEAIKESLGKNVTESGFKDLLENKAQTFLQKFDRTPAEALKAFTDPAKTFMKLDAANFVMHKAVDKAQEETGDKPVFNENLGTLAENVNRSLTQQVPLFGALPALGKLSKLMPNSSYENDVVKSVMQDPSENNVSAIKDAIYNHGMSAEQGKPQWTPEEMDATFKHVDKIAEAAKALPKDLPENKRFKAATLVLDRNALQEHLDGIQKEKQTLDKSIQDIPTAKETYLTDKIKQANDKLRDIVGKTKTTYSKGVEDKEQGKFFKTTDGNKEEITPSRYDLENTERTAKKVQSTEINNNLNQTENGNNGEKISSGGQKEESPESKGEEKSSSGITENGKEIDQKGGSDGKSEDVIKSGAGEIVPDIKELGNNLKVNDTTNPTTGGDNNPAAVEGTASEVQPNTSIEAKGEATPDEQEQQGVEAPKISDKAKELADKIRSLKSSKNNLHGGLQGLGVAVYDGALETVATIIEQGGKLADAIQAGIDHIKSNSDIKDEDAIKSALSKDLSDIGIKEEDTKAEPTGIRNADVEAERGKVVPRDKMTKDEIEAEGKRLVDSGEIDPDELAQRVISDKKPLTAEEQAALLYHKTKLKKEQRSILKDNETNPDNVTENQIKYAKNVDLIDVNQQATEIAGNVTGRALGFRTETMNEDFSRNSVMRRAKMANQNEPLQPKDEKALEAHTKRIEELENKLSDKEEQIRKLYEEGIVNKVNRTIQREEREAKRVSTRASRQKENEGLLADLHLIAKKARSTAGSTKIPVDMIVPLSKLARNYVLDGASTIASVADRLYDNLKDHLEGVSKEDIADVIKENFSKYLHEQNELRLSRSKTLLKTKLDKLKSQNETGNFEKDIRRKIQVDNDYLRIRADINREQTLINKKIADIEQSNKSTQRKAVDFAVKYGRQAKLAAVKVLGKLAAAGLTTLSLKPITEGIGTFYSAILPKIAQKATIEGKGNLKALANAYAKAATLGMEDAYKELNIKAGGQSDLSALYGKYMIGKLPAEAADFFGHVHSAIKAPVKRFAWEYSYAKRMENQMRQGIDVQDPVIDAKNRLDAYKDAERAIFMGDNVISKAYEAALSPMEKGSSNFGKNIAATARILLPFVKVPTNIALSTGRHAFGLLMGGSKLAQIGTSAALRMAGAEKMAKIIHSGLGELTPEESDMVLRNLKHGSIGSAALAIGFFSPKNVGGFYQENEKRKKSDAAADAFKIYGHDVPKFLTEHPIFQAMQVGATFRRVLEAHKHKEDKSSAAAMATMSGLIEGIPLASEAKQFTDLFGSDTKKGAKFISNVVKGEVEPSVLQELAQSTDTKNGAAISFDSKNQNQRAPDKKHGLLKYMKQDLMMGVPGARKYVPKKH